MQLSEELSRDLINHWHTLISNSPMSEIHAYMKARDLAYAKWETDLDRNQDNFHVRLLYSQADTARAKLNNIFLAAMPIFEVVSPAKLRTVAEQYSAIYEADSSYFGWVSELSVAHLDGLKYNLLAAEVTWDVVRTYSSTDGATNKLNKNAAVEREVVYQGNNIKRIDLYNAFWDTTVPPKKVHSLGDYAGYTEVYTPVRLTELLDELGVPTTPAVRDPIFSSSASIDCFMYSTPDLAAGSMAISPEDSAANFDVPDSVLRRGSYKLTSGVFHVTKLYERLIPSDYGLRGPEIKNPNIPSVFKFIIVNGKFVVSATQETNTHNFLPIVFGQPLDEGLRYQSKSFTHNLEELQAIASKLITTEIKSSKRMLVDRGIYDPQLLNKRDINSPNPAAKIPLRASAIGRSLSEAYYPIPYEDRAMGSRINQASAILSFGSEISGLNQVTQGQFVKGNKTNDQFMESMASSGQRVISMAQSLEDSFYSVIKFVTKKNILAKQPPDKVLSRALGQEIVLKPEELKLLDPEFKVSDGLIPADRLASTELLVSAIQTIGATQDLALTFDVAGMIVHLLSLRGLKNLDQYKLSTEQQQAKLAQLQQAQQGVQDGQPTGN